MSDLPIFESRVCFHTCLLPTPLSSHPWSRHQSLCPGQREKPRRRHSGKGFLKEKPRLLNVKGGKEVKRWAGQGANWNSAAPGRNDSEGSLATLIPCPAVKKRGQNKPQAMSGSVTKGPPPCGATGMLWDCSKGRTGDIPDHRGPQREGSPALPLQSVCWSGRDLPNLPPREPKPSTGHLPLHLLPPLQKLSLVLRTPKRSEFLNKRS